MARTRVLQGRRLKTIALALVLICLSGSALEEFGRHGDRRRYEQIGNSIDIGGRKLNIFCVGQGSPTVVFDTYGHQSGYSWIAVQRQTAKYTRACWYDRAGYGWSELGRGRRTFQAVASDLHALLLKAGIPFPMILVGAGDAASHIRVYHGSYPNEVAGAVMLDANDVDDPNAQIPEAEKGGFQRYFGAWASDARNAACSVRPFLGRLGIIRFASLFGRPRETNSFGLTAVEQAELDDLSDNATTQQATEACAREESMKQVQAAGDLGNVPLVVVVSNARRPRSASQTAADSAWEEERIGRTANALAGLSTRRRVSFIEGNLTTDTIVRSILEVLPAKRISK